MPANIVNVNGKEFVVPDSWMPVLWAYLQLVEDKTKVVALEQRLTALEQQKKEE